MIYVLLLIITFFCSNKKTGINLVIYEKVTDQKFFRHLYKKKC